MKRKLKRGSSRRARAPISRRSLPLLELRAYERKTMPLTIRTRIDPGGMQNARSLSPKLRYRKTASQKYQAPSIPSYRPPLRLQTRKLLTVCQTRGVRKSVLFATQTAGKGRSFSPGPYRKHTPDSKVTC